jgi:surfactin synthase thioesterase subunit/acyl carrier protein/NAD(P)-dependent dehydrogenase (short-subunit alcohol dehydrogenase family)
MLMVWKRGELIDRFCPSGKMAVIFCEASGVEAEITSSKCSIAAINSPTKTVISGDTAEIVRLTEHFDAIGIQHADVKSQFAFHSYQMDAVVEPFMEYLRQFSFRAPSRKWLSCSNGNLMEHAPSAVHWAKHLRDTVNFRKAALLLEKFSPKQIIEIGPGSGTLYSVSENLDCSGIALLRTMNFKKGDRTELYFVLDTLGQLFRSGMNLRPQAIPGGGNFPQLIPGLTFSQHSYWLEGLNAGAVSAFASHQANTTKMAETPPNKPKLHFDLQWEETDNSFADTIALNESVKDINWIVIGDGAPLAESLVKKLHHHKAHVFHIATPAQSKKTLLPDIVVSATADKSEWRKALDTIVNFKSRVNISDWRMIWVTGNKFDAGNTSAADDLNKPLQLLLPLLQALQESIPMLRLWIVTEESQLVTRAQKPFGLNLQAASTWGFAKTLFLEHPEWRGGMIDTDSDPLDTELILKKISKPGVGAESCVALRSGRQYIQKIHACENYPVEVAALRTDGIYFITGGLGGLGLATACWLADKGVRHLMLLGRRRFPELQDWESVSPEDPAYQPIEELRRLRARGVTVEVVQGDVRDVQLLKSLFGSIDERKIPLRGVIHAAGVNWFSKIMQMDGEQLHSTLEIKTNATWALHEMTAGRDLDCFVLFSSVSALWGSVELSHYTAANHFMDMLSQYRHAMGLKSCTINWGPWAEAGMSAGPREKEVLSKLGFRLLATQDAIDAMDRVVACSQPLSLIAEVDWHKFRVFTDFSLQPSLFNELTDVDVNEKRSRQGVVESIRSESPEKARDLIEEYVRTELRMVMLIESIDSIDSDQRFNFLGMDSLMAITFVVQLEELFECKLPTTLVYNYPTIKSVCDYLFEDIYCSDKENVDQEVLTEHQEQALHACRKILKECELSEKVTLFCFPYAGSGASAYMPWPSHFNGNLEIVAMQPPGREDRSNEPPFASMTEIVAELLAGHTDPNGDFYFFGHSLGALIAYEFCVALKNAGRKLPARLFLSGCSAPVAHACDFIHELQGDDFLDAVINFSGDGADTIGKRAVIQHNYNLLKHDIKVLENYQPKQETIAVPLTAIFGLQDPLAPLEGVQKWEAISTEGFDMVELEGGHELLQQHLGTITAIIRDTIAERSPKGVENINHH